MGGHAILTMTEVDTDDVGRIVASEKRYATLSALYEEPLTPSKIARSAGLNNSEASAALRVLREMEVVTLVVDESRRKGRIHDITDYGEAVYEYIENEAPNLKPNIEEECPVCGHEVDAD